MMTVGTRNEANRIAWIEKTLKQIPAGSRILDAGAGEQKFKSFCTHLDYVAQDFAQYNGLGDSRGLQTGTWDQSKLDIVSDITSIPEQNESFDAVMCIEVFEHLPDPVAAIKEFRRLLKAGGYLILTAPFCSLTHFAPYHYYSGFNSYFYEKQLMAEGFEIVEIDANGNFFEYLAQEVRRVPQIAGKYCDDRMGLMGRLGMYLLLRALGRFSRQDIGSKELLCFGYHIFARKITGKTK